jgi:carbon-monoxide dehydrogenase iron sulfur subunit
LSKAYRVYISPEVCIGCGLCRVYCQTEHSRSKDIIKAFKRETPRPLPRIRVERNGEVCFPIQCRHCCILACPYGALTRDMSNSLVVKCDLCPDQDIPVCVANCPNEALVLSTNGEDGKVWSQS